MTKGEIIKTPEDAVLRIMRGEVLHIDDRVLDPGWSGNWSITTIRRLVSQGRLSTSAEKAGVGDVESRILKAGQVAIDELIDRIDGKHPGNDDLADYMGRIVDACVRAALAKEWRR